jgi:hypothetical protein
MEDIRPEKVIPNPTGKGGFQDHPELINAGGRPKNQQSFAYWLNTFKEMPVREFLDWPKNNPEETRTVASDLAWARIFEARKDLKNFREVANRTEGMPIQTNAELPSDQIDQYLHIYKPEKNAQ